MCGPFRIYDEPTDIISIQIDVASDWFQTLWLIVTSSAFITAIILVLVYVDSFVFCIIVNESLVPYNTSIWTDSRQTLNE